MTRRPRNPSPAPPAAPEPACARCGRTLAGAGLFCPACLEFPTLDGGAAPLPQLLLPLPAELRDREGAG